MNLNLMHQAINAQLSNARNVIAHTKVRSEVRGGGRKPWKQKGTGRARAGTNRSPLWTGGGIIFGPRKNRNYSKKLPKKMRKKAIFMALSDHFKNKPIFIVDKLDDFKKANTKNALRLIGKLSIKYKSLLIILDKKMPNLTLSVRNISYINVIAVNNLSLIDILKHNQILMPKSSLDKIKELFLKQKTKAVPDELVDSKKGQK